MLITPEASDKVKKILVAYEYTYPRLTPNDFPERSERDQMNLDTINAILTALHGQLGLE